VVQVEIRWGIHGILCTSLFLVYPWIFFFIWRHWGLNLGPHTCSGDALPFEPHELAVFHKKMSFYCAWWFRSVIPAVRGLRQYGGPEVLHFPSSEELCRLRVEFLAEGPVHNQAWQWCLQWGREGAIGQPVTEKKVGEPRVGVGMGLKCPAKKPWNGCSRTVTLWTLCFSNVTQVAG
jgi:hypothetical protein